MPYGDWEPSPKDILIDRVRRGQMTPEEAEAEAARQGFGPIATKPSRIQFDPNRMPWWSLPMVLAWIAWRTVEHVQESCAEYRENWLEWFPGSWSVLTEDGQRFERIDGYELKSLGRSTAVRLTLVEIYMRKTETSPATAQMTLTEAEKELFDALAAGQLVAVARDKRGDIVDIPQREWPYLQLFEEGNEDVLKHDPLDRSAAFTDIKFKRDDIERLWPESVIAPQMIEPMTRPGKAGYVPLCSVLHWIMTHGGSVMQQMKDQVEWQTSVDRLLPFISTEKIEVIGRARSGGAPQPIKGHTFVGMLIPGPVSTPFSVLAGDDPWICCSAYVDEESWLKEFNDQMYLNQRGAAEWTHICLKKADVLANFQFGEANEVSYETGAPGRPTSIQLVRAEFASRVSRCMIERSVTEEAAALAKWLKTTHPKAPQLKAKTIINNLGSDYRKARARK